MRCASGDPCREAAADGERFCADHLAALHRVRDEIARAGGPRGRRKATDDDVVVPDLALTPAELAEHVTAAVKTRAIDGDTLAATFGLDPASATWRRGVDIAVERGRVRRHQVRPGHVVIESATPAASASPGRPKRQTAPA